VGSQVPGFLRIIAQCRRGSLPYAPKANAIETNADLNGSGPMHFLEEFDGEPSDGDKLCVDR